MLLAAACAPPAIVKKVAPSAVYASSSDGVELKVSVRVSVSADGNVTAASVVRTTGVASLDEAALAAIKQWRFAPSTTCAVTAPFQVGFAFPGVAVPAGYDACSHDAFALLLAPTDYPRAAYPAGGQTALVVQIGSDASIKSVTVMVSSGSKALDQAAIDVVRASVIAPKVVNCRPEDGSFAFRVTFDPNR